MARLDVYVVAGAYYLDVQSNILPLMNTRMVVPLLPANRTPAPIRRLHPALTIRGQVLIMATHLMGAIPVKSLGKPVASAMHDYDDIVAAIDMVFNGF
jgi:toxin CcdB